MSPWGRTVTFADKQKTNPRTADIEKTLFSFLFLKQEMIALWIFFRFAPSFLSSWLLARALFVVSFPGFNGLR